MSSSASEVDFRAYLSHKSVKSYTRRTNIIFVVVSAMYFHKTFFLQAYCGPFTKQFYI